MWQSVHRLVHSIYTSTILCTECLLCYPASLSRWSNTSACLPGIAGKLIDHISRIHLLEVLIAAFDFVPSCKENASTNKDFLWVSGWMIIFYRESAKGATGDKRLMEGGTSTTKTPKLPITLVFYWVKAVTMQYGGHLPRQMTLALHKILLPKPRQTKAAARALLCALDAEDSGFAFTLGKKGSPSQMEKLWHGHRQEQHTELCPKLSNEHG